MPTRQSSPPRRSLLERVRQLLDSARALDDHVKADIEAVDLRMARQPGARGTPDTRDFPGVDHLQRVAEAAAALRLHLAEHHGAAAARDDVDLSPCEPAIRVEDAIATQAVPASGAPLRIIPRLRGGRRGHAMTCGGSRRALAHARS